MSRNQFRTEVGTTLAERTALLAAIASTGLTFDRGLMPRNAAGQALATGLTGSVSYGLLVTSQSLLWAGAAALAPWRLPAEPGFEVEGGLLREHRGGVRVLAYGTYLSTLLAARPLQQSVDQVRGESTRRAVLRSALGGLESASALGLVATAASDAVYSAMTAVGAGTRVRRLVGDGATLALGAGLATALVHQGRRREARATGQSPPRLSPRTAAIGLGTAAALTALGHAETLGARTVGGMLPAKLSSPVESAAGHAVMLGALGLAVWRGLETVYANTERAGSALEPLHARPPKNLHVSGGPASAVAWQDLTREGRRFTGLPLSKTEIGEVMGSCVAEPVRVFVPIDAAEDASGRAQIAIEEMEALGAFDRSVVVLCSPTGTGYVNYVMAEAVEYLTRGDCAIVSTQYSLRPSFLSLDRVAVGRHNARALFNAVHDRVAAMPVGQRPRLVQFGESLGAHTGQDVMMHRGAAAFGQLLIERALFIGTPDESKWAKEWRADPTAADPTGIVIEVDSYEEFQALPESQRLGARIVLLSHHEDPITKFGPELAYRRPDWLAPRLDARPPGIPAEMRWHPIATFFVTASDVINAMSVVPGTFGADGHDYRSDLARFVSAVYDLPATVEQMARIERALRRRELLIAESRLVADEMSTVQSRARETLGKWGVDPEAAGALIGAEVKRSQGLLADA